ncbi:hypothetical protein MRX96_033060 [Rhipicephalus microplus]
MQSTVLKRLPSCREPSPDVQFLTSSSHSCGPRGEGLCAVPSAVLWQKIRQLSSSWTLSVRPRKPTMQAKPGGCLQYYLQLSTQFNCVAASAITAAWASHPSASTAVAISLDLTELTMVDIVAG